MLKRGFQKPRIKSCYYVIPHGHHHIQIGVTYGHAFSIDDKNGKARSILDLMNGERTIHQISEILKNKYGDITDRRIGAFVSKLDHLGLVEDMSTEPPAEFSSPELQRYKNQLAFFLMFAGEGQTQYEFQRRLKNSTVTLIGLGGGGSNILISLAAIGVGKIIGVDFDRVEMKNLNRQILYTKKDVGKLKTDVAAQRVKEINSHVEFNTVEMRVDSLAKARRLIRNTNFVICTADGPVFSLYDIVNRACVEKGVPWISFGTVEATGIVGPLVVPGKTACYQCVIDERRRKNPHYLENIDYIRVNEKYLDAHLTYPSIVPIFSFCGSLIVLESVKHLTGFAKPWLSGKSYSIDFATMKSSTDNHRKREKCPVCMAAPKGIRREL